MIIVIIIIVLIVVIVIHGNNDNDNRNTSNRNCKSYYLAGPETTFTFTVPRLVCRMGSLRYFSL